MRIVRFSLLGAALAMAMIGVCPDRAAAQYGRVMDGSLSQTVFEGAPISWPTGAEPCQVCPPRKKGPKTLFEWAIGKKEKHGQGECPTNGNGENGGHKDNGDGGKAEANGEKKDGADDKKNGAEEGQSKNGNGKNGNGNGKNGNGNGEGGEDAEPEGPDRLTSDRPDFTEASSTVGLGRVQLEAGYTYSRDRANGVTRQAHSYPEALLRIGLFAEWFELRLGQNWANEKSRGPTAGDRSSANGAEDLYLGVKLGLSEQSGCLPEMALILQATVPTGADVFSTRQVMPGFNFLFSWEVIEDCLSLGGSFQMNRARDDSDHFFLEVAQSLTVGYTLAENLTAYTEWFAFYPSSAVDPGAKPQYYLNGGFQYYFTDNFAADIRAGVGLNRHADDFFAGTGFVVRY